MNRAWTLLVFTALTLSAQLGRAAEPASPDPQGILSTVEVPIEIVMAPPAGYDDNDNVELVLHGRLPNACYILLQPAVERRPDGRFQVRQLTALKRAGFCKYPFQLPPEMSFPIPFQSEVSVGQLELGNAEFVYAKPSGDEATRSLYVAHATASTMDDLPYAAVSQISVADVLSSNDKIQVTLMGVLNSSCSELDDKVQAQTYADTTVLLPTVHVKPGVVCKQVTIPFIKLVTLPASKPGHRLIMVRSMSGRSVNRIVEVVK